MSAGCKELWEIGSGIPKLDRLDTDGIDEESSGNSFSDNEDDKISISKLERDI